jgi:hypothetical protein
MASTIKETDCLGEPSLDELFAEPMIQLFMKRDGVKPSDLLGQLHRMTQRGTPQPTL